MSLDNQDDQQRVDPGIDSFLGDSGEVVDTSTIDTLDTEEADMAAGYASARGEEVEEVAGSTDTLEADPEPQAAAPEPAPEPERIGGKWTVADIEARFADLEGLKKGQSTVAGHIGDLRNRMAGQKPRTITKDDLKKVVEQFGEEYADALVEDLNTIGFGGGNSGPTPAEIDKLVNERAMEHAREQTDGLRREFNKREVLRTHKDADEHFVNVDRDGRPVVGKHNAAFLGWMATLQGPRQQEIATSWDPDVMTTALTEFKQSRAAPTASPATQPAPAAAARASRVARAVSPRGSGAAAPPVGDPFLDGYQAAKSGR